MDLGFIDMCLKSYDGKLGEDDAMRLQFFRGLWGVMAETANARGDAPYEVPSLDELRELYVAGTPVFDTAPVAVNADEFAKTAQAIVTYLIESGHYEPALSEALTAIDWTSAFDGADDDAQAAQLAALVASLALYTFYEKPAEAIMKAIGYDEVINTHPLLCPVCGGEPLLASVGTKTSSAGRGRLLYCATCGAPWEFDRVRCARCGTHDQTKLHYTSIEGDEDHRLAHCDECGGFMRTTFMDSSLFPLSPLVEDVVMAPLAALATERAR